MNNFQQKKKTKRDYLGIFLHRNKSQANLIDDIKTYTKKSHIKCSPVTLNKKGMSSPFAVHIPWFLSMAHFGNLHQRVFSALVPISDWRPFINNPTELTSCASHNRDEWSEKLGREAKKDVIILICLIPSLGSFIMCWNLISLAQKKNSFEAKASCNGNRKCIIHQLQYKLATHKHYQQAIL